MEGDGECRVLGLEYIDGGGGTPRKLFLGAFDTVGTVIKRGSLHSIHRLSRFEQGAQTNVCPHGSTTGGRSSTENSSKQMMQWNGTIEAAAAATFILDVMLSYTS